MFPLDGCKRQYARHIWTFRSPDNNRQSGKKYAVFYKIRLARIILNIIGGRVLKIVFKGKLIAVNHSQTASLFVQRQNTDFRPVAVLPGFFKIITGFASAAAYCADEILLCCISGPTRRQQCGRTSRRPFYRYCPRRE